LIERKCIPCDKESINISLSCYQAEAILPKEKITGLISELHEKINASDTSPQQELLLAQLNAQLDSWEGPKPANGDIKDVIDELLVELEEKHPKAARIALEIVESLGRLGL
jgi:hypothetical protein